MVLALKYLAEKKIVHGDMHWDNILYPYYSDLQHNDDWDYDSQLEILIDGKEDSLVPSWHSQQLA